MNVPDELQSRNATFNRLSPSWVLEKKLLEVIEQEKQEEEAAFDAAKWWHRWQDDRYAPQAISMLFQPQCSIFAPSFSVEIAS